MTTTIVLARHLHHNNHYNCDVQWWSRVTKRHDFLHTTAIWDVRGLKRETKTLREPHYSSYHHRRPVAYILLLLWWLLRGYGDLKSQASTEYKYTYIYGGGAKGKQSHNRPAQMQGSNTPHFIMMSVQCNARTLYGGQDGPALAQQGGYK